MAIPEIPRRPRCGFWGVALGVGVGLVVGSPLGATPAPPELEAWSLPGGHAPPDVHIWVQCLRGPAWSMDLVDPEGTSYPMAVVQEFSGAASLNDRYGGWVLQEFAPSSAVPEGTYEVLLGNCYSANPLTASLTGYSPGALEGDGTLSDAAASRDEECIDTYYEQECVSGNQVNATWQLPAVNEPGWVALSYDRDSKSLGEFTPLTSAPRSLVATFYVPDEQNRSEVCPVLEIYSAQGKQVSKVEGDCVQLLGPVAAALGCSGCHTGSSRDGGWSGWYAVAGLVLLGGRMWRRRGRG